mgnify:CR=1 FL=1
MNDLVTYRNKKTGDIVEARPNVKFPEYQLLRWDEGAFGGVKTCTSMLVTDFEKEFIKVKQRYFYVVYQYNKGGIICTATSYSMTEDGSHFNSIQFINSVKKREKATKVIIDNFIELTERDFKDFQRDIK